MSKLPTTDTRALHIQATDTLLHAVSAINNNEAHIALVVEAHGALIGTVTDGDVRRAMLKGCSTDSPVALIMNRTPVTLPANATHEQALEIMRTLEIRQIPLVNTKQQVCGLLHYDALMAQANISKRSTPVVIMAGGLGKRLHPITMDVPKPMVEVHGRPMLEWIVKRFVSQGFQKFYFAINYLGEMIESHFKDGEEFDCNIHYLREHEFLGTAGALSLLDPVPNEPILVMNGDILADIDFGAIVDFHQDSGAIATICGRIHRLEVPFGVITHNNGQLLSIREKPIYEDLVSAGIYILQPGTIGLIPKNTRTDMPSLLLQLVEKNHRVAVFPMREQWVDVGRKSDLEFVQKNQKIVTS